MSADTNYGTPEPAVNVIPFVIVWFILLYIKKVIWSVGVACFQNIIYSIINLRLASADQNRIVESFTNFANEVNRLSLNNFLSHVSVVANDLKGKRIQSVYPEGIIPGSPTPSLPTPRFAY